MIKRKKLPNKKEILSVLKYDSKTGDFVWRSRNSNFFNEKRIGQIAGTTDSEGYRRIVIHRQSFFAHRLAWLIVYNEQPNYIDHVDGNKANNRISNLRAVSQRQNQTNRTIHRTGHLLGTTKIREGKWRAQIESRRNSVRFHRHLGYFETQEQAHAAYMKAASKLV